MNAFTFQIILWIDITEHDKMKREFIHITDNNKHRLMSDSGFWHGSTNENSRDKMKKILSMAVLNELTERQRICIVDYYLNGKKEKEIAKELGVNSSTVSRHIMKARDKLRRQQFQNREDTTAMLLRHCSRFCKGNQFPKDSLRHIRHLRQNRFGNNPTEMQHCEYTCNFRFCM